MNTDNQAFKTSLRHSLSFRVLLIVIGFVMAVIVSFITYITRQFQELTAVNIYQEGLLPSNTLEAGVRNLLANGDIPAVQTYLDNLVDMRGRNDIEINIMLLSGNRQS